jgi:hypothetical protein
MKRLAIAALALGACSAPVVQNDIDVTNSGLIVGITACHRHVIDGVPLNRSVSEAARGRKLERITSWSPELDILPPGWKIDGVVSVGLNDRGGCNIHIGAGDGPELSNIAVTTHLGMSSRRWARMRIVAAPPGYARDALCTVDRLPPDTSMSVVMTSREDSGDVEERAFVATVLRADRASCVSQQIR